MIQSNGNIWVTAGDSVYRYLGNRSWLTYQDEDGLNASRVFDIYEDSQNRIWTATSNGVFIFNKGYDRFAPQTYVLSDKNANEYTPNSTISFSFIGDDPNYQTPKERLLYSYRINQNSWSPYSQDTYFTTTGLEDGEYVFEVRSIDSAGNIDPTPYQFQFTVVKEWYSHFSFYVLLFIIFLLIVVLIVLMIRYHKRLYDQAVKDHLTQLFNRSYFDQILENEFSRSKRYSKDMSLLLIDIDHFKSINDKFGHDVGDYVIAETAKRMNNMIRDIDTISRWGGEEFLTLLPETDVDRAANIAERLRMKIHLDPYLIGKHTLNISISIGVAAYAEGVETVDEILKRADEALYTAKDNGRNRVEVYQQDNAKQPGLETITSAVQV